MKTLTVVYGANSYIARGLIKELYPEGLVTVGNSECDFTYESFNEFLVSPSGSSCSITRLVYATGRPQPPESRLRDNPDLFKKNVYDFFELMENLENHLHKDVTIVYLSSGHASRASDLNPYYASSKAAVNSYVISMSKKFAKMNLQDGGTRRINALAPEAIESPMIDQMLSEGTVSREDYIMTRPNMRLLRLEEVVNPLIFMLSNNSTGLNGQILILGGVK